MMAAEEFECDKSDACFGTDPEALEYANSRGDILYQANKSYLLGDAFEAGQQGVPFDEATYRSVSLVSLQIGSEGVRTPINELSGEDDGEMKLKMARCAYACGAVATGNCPRFRQL